MKNNVYFIPPNIKGYRKTSFKDLSSLLKEESLNFQEPEIGGGVGEIVRQIIAYITISDFWLGILTNLTANRIERILAKLFKWNKENKNKDNNLPSVVNIYIYPTLTRKENISVSFDIGKKFTKEEILKILEKTFRK